MPTLSAGLLLYRQAPTLQVLLGHMGGPYWARKDDGGWTIPKGEVGPEEDPRAAARREFAEELGIPAPELAWQPLGSAVVSGRKTVLIWTGQADLDVSSIASNTFELEWPRGSGRLQSFPEIDRADWFDVETARSKLVASQTGFLDRLLAALEA